MQRANTTYGVIGVKVWIYKGEVLKGEIPAQRTTEKPRRRNNDNRSRRPRIEKKKREVTTNLLPKRVKSTEEYREVV